MWSFVTAGTAAALPACFVNRRIRNRTYGGVGGRRRRLRLLPDYLISRELEIWLGPFSLYCPPMLPTFVKALSQVPDGSFSEGNGDRVVVMSRMGAARFVSFTCGLSRISTRQKSSASPGLRLRCSGRPLLIPTPPASRSAIPRKRHRKSQPNQPLLPPIPPIT